MRVSISLRTLHTFRGKQAGHSGDLFFKTDTQLSKSGFAPSMHRVKLLGGAAETTQPDMIGDAIRCDVDFCRQLSDDICRVLSEPELPGQLMLHAAITSRLDAVISLSSSRPTPVLANIAGATAVALKLVELASHWRASRSPLIT